MGSLTPEGPGPLSENWGFSKVTPTAADPHGRLLSEKGSQSPQQHNPEKGLGILCIHEKRASFKKYTYPLLRPN